MEEFLSISILIILAAISPGPDFAMVIKNSVMHSRKIGIFTAAGVSFSFLIHSVYCILGLAIIISKSLLAFSIIKYCGAAYLVYIGVKSLRVKREDLNLQATVSNKPITGRQAFVQGLLCNLLNPKAIMFLLVFFTIVVGPGHSLFSEMGYGLEIALIHMIWFSSLAYMLTHQYVAAKLNRIQFYIVKVMGAVLVAFGLRVAMLSNPV